MKQNRIILLCCLFILFSISFSFLSNVKFLNGEIATSEDILPSEPYQNELNFPTQTPQSSDLLTFPWWDTDWTFRTNVNVSSVDSITYQDKLVSVSMNVTDLLNDMITSGTLDENSIRVIEWDPNFSSHDEKPSQIEYLVDYDPFTNANIEIYWAIEDLVSDTTIIFFIYFDILENDIKSSPNYAASTSLLLTVNTEGKDYTIENTKIRISAAEGAPPNGGSYYDHIYQVFDKRTNKDLQVSTYHWGWVLYEWDYGSVYTTNFDKVTSISVKSNGPVFITLIMEYDAPNFLYEREYTLNYLDDVIQITHRVTAKTYISQGDWKFASWWNPGYGTSDNKAPNSGYGFGGYDWGSNADTGYDPSGEFTGSGDLYYFFGGWRNNDLNSIRPESWWVNWDENLNEGVGTLWDIETSTSSYRTYLSEYGYLSASNQDGKNLWLHMKPRQLSSGQNFEFNIWGHIFEGSSGVLTKQRSSGIRNIPSLTIGMTTTFGKIFSLKLIDSDANPIENIIVKIQNETNNDLQSLYTNAQGNVTFRHLYPNNWNVQVVLELGSINYTILNYQLVIESESSQFIYYNTKICNLSFIELTVVDDSIADPNYWALYNANLTLCDFYSGENLTNFYSNTEGKISMFLPLTTWNFSIQYQGISRMFKIGESGVLKYQQSYDLQSSTSLFLNLSISEFKTQISISDISFEQNNWDHFSYINNPPYSISIYNGDFVQVEFYVEDLHNSIGLSGITLGTWNLTKNGVNMNSSSNIGIMDTSGGHYNLTIYSTDYAVGTYDLFFAISKPLYQDAQFSLKISILNHTSDLSYVGVSEIQNIYWNTTNLYQFNYTSLYPSSVNISDATVTYHILETGKSGVLTLNQSNFGIYDFDWVANISKGLYSILITANKSGFAFANTLLYVQILAIPTLITYNINPEFAITTNSLKVSLEENVSFEFTYKDLNGNALNEESVTIYLNEMDTLPYSTDGLGKYYCNFKINDYTNDTGINSIKIDLRKDNYEGKLIEFEADFIEAWDSKLDIVVPPSFYPWSNNVSFIVKYQSNEYPRLNWALEGGEIHQLDIYYTKNNSQLLYTMLNDSTRGNVWDWEDLFNHPDYGNGYYLIWFDSSILNITDRTAFYPMPYIIKNQYVSASAMPYAWIEPVEVGLKVNLPTSHLSSIGDLNLYLDEILPISVHLNVTDENSILYGNEISNADIHYFIYGVEDNLLYDSGLLISESNGLYSFSLSGFQIGSYNMILVSNMSNFKQSQVNFVFSCNPKPIKIVFGANVTGNIVFSPQNQNLTFMVNLYDDLTQVPLSDVLISAKLNEKQYTFSEDSSNPGVYVITFPSEIFQELKSGQSYVLELTISKDNYASEIIPMTLSVGLPVDPYFNVPLIYWFIVGGTATVVISLVLVRKGIKYAKLPQTLKNIQKSKKIIKKNRQIPEKRLGISVDQQISRIFEKEWEFFGLNLRKILQDQEKTKLFEKNDQFI